MTVTRLLYSSDSHPAMGVYKAFDPPLKELLLQRMEPLLELDGGDAVSFSYSRLPDGSALISRAEGLTARALFLSEGTADLGGLQPVDLWRSPLWDRWEENPGSGLPPGERLSPDELAASLQRIEQAQPGRLERFFADVLALFTQAPGRQIVLLAQPEDIACYIQAAYETLPHEFAHRLTFTSRSGDPRTAYQQIVGAPEPPTPGFTEPEVRYQYRVHDLIDGIRDSPPAGKPDVWARKFALERLKGRRDTQNAPVRRPGQEAPAHPAGPEERPITREEFLKALHGTTDAAADALNRAADMTTLGDLPDEEVRHLGRRLCENDLDFIEVCGGPLAALKDGRLLKAALHDVDRRARQDPHGWSTASGFRALQAGHLGQLPSDCVHLRVLAAASVEDAAASPDARAQPTASQVVSVLRAAGLAGEHGTGPALTTALSLYWPGRTIPPADANELLDALPNDDPPGLFDEDVLNRLVDSALNASEPVAGLNRLAARLLEFPLRSEQQGALSVLCYATEVHFAANDDEFKSLLEKMAVSLRDRSNVTCSPDVERWWIEMIINALFHPDRDELWLAAAAELARCGNRMLLQQYATRIWESPRVKGALSKDPELLAYAIVTWEKIDSENRHWEDVKRSLRKSAAQLKRRGFGKQVDAEIRRLGSETEESTSSRVPQRIRSRWPDR